MADLKWFEDHLAPDAALVDQTTAFTTIGLWGPRARDIVQSVTRADMSDEAFRFGTCRTVEIGSQLVLASRISYVGDLGWELYVPIEQGRRLWEELWAAGRPHGLTACGMGVYGTTGRLEKAIACSAPSSIATTLWSRPTWRRSRSRPRTSSAGMPSSQPWPSRRSPTVHPDGR